MLPFAFTIFAGAFLLFAVEPLIGKFVLPWFGGGPGVWTTCLLFFQTALLGGYAYAHFITNRLAPRRQAILHLALLAAALVALPIIPGAQWKPIDGSHPIPRILLLLAANIGLPFFVLAATGPLLQRWFSYAWPAQSPYRLYALSNVGSLLALLAYPFYFEWAYSRQTQATLWSAGLAIFTASSLWCAARIWRSPTSTPVTTADGAPAEATPPVSVSQRLLWFGLAAVASVLLLATTNKLCLDVASVPFLWILPLGLYLLSFIVCFDRERWYSRRVFGTLAVAGALVVTHLLFAGSDASLGEQIAGYSTALFAACMVCHGELFRLRPAAARLTSFYFHVAAGGAAGALAVAVVAPLAFDRFLELQIGWWLLVYLLGVLCFRLRSRALAFAAATGTLLAGLVVPGLKAAEQHSDAAPAIFYFEQVASLTRENWPLVGFLAVNFLLGLAGRRVWLRDWRPRAGGAVMLFSLALGVVLLTQIRGESLLAFTTSRDFYGVVKVYEHDADDANLHHFSLVHGSTLHGLQFTDSPQSTWATTYYGPNSGLGLAIQHLARTHPLQLGLVGLGSGTAAIYGESRGRVRIYEIDPQVERIARTRFTYLARSAAQVDVIMGDARLSMERELASGGPQHFDVLALDAFTSDAIPIHLLTAEAFAIYLRHLAPDGVIAVHISNRHLRLRPVVENLARHFGLTAVTITDDPPKAKWWLDPTTWVLVTRNRALLADEEIQDAASGPDLRPNRVGLWTDDHASLFPILR